MDRPETDGVVDELHQEVVLLRIAVVDEEARVDPAAAGLEPVPRVPASDPPPPRDHLPPVRVAPEEFDDEERSAHSLRVEGSFGMLEDCFLAERTNNSSSAELETQSSPPFSEK